MKCPLRNALRNICDAAERVRITLPEVCKLFSRLDYCPLLVMRRLVSHTSRSAEHLWRGRTRTNTIPFIGCPFSWLGYCTCIVQYHSACLSEVSLASSRWTHQTARNDTTPTIQSGGSCVLDRSAEHLWRGRTRTNTIPVIGCPFSRLGHCACIVQYHSVYLSTVSLASSRWTHQGPE